MEENFKYYSEIEKYEIININDGDKYGFLGNNDVIIDGQGYLKAIIIPDSRSKFGFFSKTELLQVPWSYVKKIGSRTIIVDVESKDLKKIR